MIDRARSELAERKLQLYAARMPIMEKEPRITVRVMPTANVDITNCSTTQDGVALGASAAGHSLW